MSEMCWCGRRESAYTCSVSLRKYCNTCAQLPELSTPNVFLQHVDDLTPISTGDIVECSSARGQVEGMGRVVESQVQEEHRVLLVERTDGVSKWYIDDCLRRVH